MELKRRGADFVKDKNELLSLLNISENKLNIMKEVSTKIPGHLKSEKKSNEDGVMDDVKITN